MFVPYLWFKEVDFKSSDVADNCSLAPLDGCFVRNLVFSPNMPNFFESTDKLSS